MGLGREEVLQAALNYRVGLDSLRDGEVIVCTRLVLHCEGLALTHLDRRGDLGLGAADGDHPVSLVQRILERVLPGVACGAQQEEGFVFLGTAAACGRSCGQGVLLRRGCHSPRACALLFAGRARRAGFTQSIQLTVTCQPRSALLIWAGLQARQCTKTRQVGLLTVNWLPVANQKKM